MLKNIKVDNDTHKETNEELVSDNMEKYSLEITDSKAFQDFLDGIKKDSFKENENTEETIKDIPKLEIVEIDSKAEVGRSFLDGNSCCIICENEKIRSISDSQLNKDSKMHIFGCDMCQTLYKVTTDDFGIVNDFKIIDTNDINIIKNKNKATKKKKKKKKKTFGKNKKR